MSQSEIETEHQEQVEFFKEAFQQLPSLETPAPKKRKHKNQNGTLTERDFLALQWVSEQGTMTVEQIWYAVWWSPDSRSARFAYEKFLFLERHGLLKRIKTILSKKHYYHLTREGAKLITEKADSVLIPDHNTSLYEILHASFLTDLRITLLRNGRVEDWVTDRVLMVDPWFSKERLQNMIPDAIWTTKDSGRKIAIEYERTRKPLARLKAKIEVYEKELACPDRIFDTVLWIASKSSFRVLERALENHPNQKLKTLDQFLAEADLKEKPLFENRELEPTLMILG